MAQRHWYALIITENDGRWYGKFTSKARRDEFCAAGGVWVMRNAHHDAYGRAAGNREFVKARIIPTTAAAVKANMGRQVQTY